MPNPIVSVVMPVYNREDYIEEAINSILSQTYKDFELIIIDDASTDETPSLIARYKDKRIILLRNDENRGVSVSRNRGIEMAKGDFIAFMDSDDISVPTRFEKQVNILRSNRDIIICGSWLRFMGSEKIIKHKEHHDEIITRLLIHCSISLGAVMMKNYILISDRLNPDLKFGEDYDLWSRVCWLGKMYNIPEPLLIYRAHKNQLSGKYKKEQLKLDADIRLSLFKKLNYSASKFPDSLIKKIFRFDKYIKLSEFFKYLKWLNHIKRVNKIQRIFPINEFDKVIEEIRKNLLFKIYYQENSIGLTKSWRIRSLIFLRKKESLEIITKKMNTR